MLNYRVLGAATLVGESLINHALRFDPVSARQLSQLTDILAVELTEPAVTFYCCGTDQGIRIVHDCTEHVRTRLTGSPVALLGLLRQPASLAGTGVELTGDVGLLQQWQVLLRNLDIDWEDMIGKVLDSTFTAPVGNGAGEDIIGPVIADKLRQGVSWMQLQQREQQRLLKEYLTEESSLLPNRTEFDGFREQNHAFTLRLDRLSARIDAFIQTVTPTVTPAIAPTITGARNQSGGENASPEAGCSNNDSEDGATEARTAQ